MNLTFRHATPADIPMLVALVTSAYRGDASRAGWTTEADLLDGLRIDADRIAIDIERPHSVILLGESDGDTVAFDVNADASGIEVVEAARVA